MRTGVDRRTGRPLAGWSHCLQSIEHILTTALGTMVMARDYGSDVPNRIDRPANEREIAGLAMAAAQALAKDEPAFRLRRAVVKDVTAAGVVELHLAGDYYPLGHRGDFSIVERDVDGVVSIAQARAYGGAA